MSLQKNKYRNKTVVVDNIKFSSIKEGRRFTELKLLQKAGEIKDLELQKPFVLIPAQYEYYERYGKKGQRLKDGKRCIEKSCVYIADFTYIDTASGQTVVEDVKGYKDPSSAGFAKFVIKRKLMLYVYGIRIKEI